MKRNQPSWLPPRKWQHPAVPEISPRCSRNPSQGRKCARANSSPPKSIARRLQHRRRQRRPQVGELHPDRGIQERQGRSRGQARRLRHRRDREPRKRLRRNAPVARQGQAPQGLARPRSVDGAGLHRAGPRHQQGQGRPDRDDQRHPRVPARFARRHPPGQGHVAVREQAARFKVIKLDRKRNNVVVSRRAVLEESLGEEREKLLSTLSEGAIVKGIVKNITDYGAFVDLGGIDGLLHITDLAWRRVKHPSEVLAVGDEVTAKVLKFDQEKNRVSLGLKQLGDDPWVGLSRRYPPGTRLFGKVTNITDYGAFVEIESGIEGLVHVSEMDWTNKNIHPTKVVQLGDEVEVMILEIDEDRRRISLGMKQCMPNPWDEFAMNHKKGDKVKGRSSRSPTSACSSACRAASTASCTCPTCRGRTPAKRRCATTRRARKSRRSCWRSTSSASASRSASSSSKAIRSATSSPCTTRAASCRARSRARREGRRHRARR